MSSTAVHSLPHSADTPSVEELLAPGSKSRGESYARQEDDSNALLAALVRSSQDAIYSEDMSGAVTSWNTSAEHLLGYTVAEITGRDASRLIPAQRQGDELSALTTLRRGGSVERSETERLAKDGRTILVSLTQSPIREADGTLIGIATIARDISERKHHERVLRESEEQFRTLARSLPQLAWMTDKEGNLTWHNQRWTDYTGKTRQTMKAEGWAGVYHPEYLDEIAAAWQRSHASDAPFEGECLLRGTDGSFRPFLVRGAPLQNSKNGEWLVTAIDIADRLEAEAALRESEERFRNVADAAPVIIWLAGPDRLFYYFNKAWIDFTGHAIEGEIDIQWADKVHPDDLARCQAKYHAAFHSRAPFELEYRLRHYSGKYRWLLERGIPRFTPEGNFGGYIGAGIDIHDQKESAEAVRIANESASRAKDQFLATLSHELRTPLTPVLMLAASMEQMPGLPPQVRADCAMIRKNVELEARLIDDLLDLTRITQGKMMLRLENLDPHPLIEHSLEILRGDLNAKEIHLDVQFCKPAPTISADSVRLQQVFWNILKNAVKFTALGGRISIRSSMDGRHWRVDITDTGLGITAEELPQIFNAFSQGTEAAQPRFGGVGLGLAISAHLVQEHNGKIWAESPGRHQGSSFHLELPLAPLTMSGRIKLPPPLPKHRALRILLVEDHEPSRTTLVRLLGNRGHTVAAAGSIAEAREVAATGTFDIVVSDLGLPDGSGHELMRHLRRDHHLCGIALSGFGMAADVKQSLEAGFTEHLTKPVDLSSLEQALLRVWNITQVPVKLR